MSSGQSAIARPRGRDPDEALRAAATRTLRSARPLPRRKALRRVSQRFVEQLPLRPVGRMQNSRLLVSFGRIV